MEIIIGKPQQYHFNVSFTEDKINLSWNLHFLMKIPSNGFSLNCSFMISHCFPLRNKILNSLPMKTAVFTLLKSLNWNRNLVVFWRFGSWLWLCLTIITIIYRLWTFILMKYDLETSLECRYWKCKCIYVCVCVGWGGGGGGDGGNCTVCWILLSYSL